MAYTYLDIFTTPGVIEAQQENGAREQWEDFSGSREFTRLDGNAKAFIGARDSFYIASNSESGWPYLQHRGGPTGFLKVLDETTLGFADYRGNRQYITTGNSKADDRVALFLMDYPRRKRMKMLAHMSLVSAAERPELTERLQNPGYGAVIERFFLLKLEAYDWNCPQHITPRFTKDMVAAALEELRVENDNLRAQLAGSCKGP